MNGKSKNTLHRLSISEGAERKKDLDTGPDREWNGISCENGQREPSIRDEHSRAEARIKRLAAVRLGSVTCFQPAAPMVNLAVESVMKTDPSVANQKNLLKTFLNVDLTRSPTTKSSSNLRFYREVLQFGGVKRGIR